MEQLMCVNDDFLLVDDFNKASDTSVTIASLGRIETATLQFKLNSSIEVVEMQLDGYCEEIIRNVSTSLSNNDS